jgi:hypothetical protein
LLPPEIHAVLPAREKCLFNSEFMGGLIAVPRQWSAGANLGRGWTACVLDDVGNGSADPQAGLAALLDVKTGSPSHA